MANCIGNCPAQPADQLKKNEREHDIQIEAIVNRSHGNIVVVCMSNCSGVQPVSQAVRWFRFSSQTQYIGEMDRLDQKVAKYSKQLRPFHDALLTSVCLSAGCRRPERLTALPSECGQCRSNHGSPPPQPCTLH